MTRRSLRRAKIWSKDFDKRRKQGRRNLMSIRRNWMRSYRLRWRRDGGMRKRRNLASKWLSSADEMRLKSRSKCEKTIDSEVCRR